MAEIGDTLKRRRKLGDDRDVIRLVGISASGWVAAPAEQHGPPFVVSVDTLAREYGGAPSLPPSEREQLAALDRDATLRATRAFGRFARPSKQPTQPPKGSPEAKFAAEANDDDGAAS